MYFNAYCAVNSKVVAKVWVYVGRGGIDDSNEVLAIHLETFLNESLVVIILCIINQGPKKVDLVVGSSGRFSVVVTVFLQGIKHSLNLRDVALESAELVGLSFQNQAILGVFCFLFPPWLAFVKANSSNLLIVLAFVPVDESFVFKAQPV